MGWSKGTLFGFGKPADAVSVYVDKRGCFHAAARHGNELWHYVRGSRNPFPWDGGRLVKKTAVGSGTIFLFPQTGNLEIIWPDTIEPHTRHQWDKPENYPDPSGEEEEEPPKLTAQNNQLFYENGGTVPIKLCGVYHWEALHRILGYIDDPPELNLSYNQYVEYLARFKTNCVRQGTVPDIALMERFTEDMKNLDKIVEWTIYNRMSWPMADPKKAVDNLIKFPNVFFDVNEFGDHYSDMDIAIDLGNYVVDKGGIFAAGSWGYSTYGQQISKTFYEKYNRHQIGSVHREWDKASIERIIKYGKIPMRDEYFDHGEGSPQKIGFEGFERIMRETFEAGAQGCLYYPFIDSWIDKPTHGREKAEKYLEFAGRLCRELNL